MIITVARIRDNVVVNIEVMSDALYDAYIGEDRLISYTQDNPAAIGGGIIGDKFYCPSPFPSWTLSQTTGYWNAPSPMPNDGKRYSWNEVTTSWAAMPQIGV